jgi:3-hydroxyisobutyrate dehydrogenase-like beta-hydroxyacid dehydrogenase
MGGTGRITRIGLLGFGEVGQRFASDLCSAGGVALATYDILFDSTDRRAAMLQRATALGVSVVGAANELVASCEMIVSAVTANQALVAARSIAIAGLPSTWVLDLNSTSPACRPSCSDVVEASGGRYVEAAVMSAVVPHGIRVPMLLGGPNAAELLPELIRLGFRASFLSTEIGIASAVKLCRSVVIKGLEALVVESFAAARGLGVEQYVIASLRETYPGIEWESHADYLFSRVVQHSRRRAEEMRASGEMLDSLGLGGLMATATEQRQRQAANLSERGVFPEPGITEPWRVRADQLLNAVRTIGRPFTGKEIAG